MCDTQRVLAYAKWWRTRPLFITRSSPRPARECCQGSKYSGAEISLAMAAFAMGRHADPRLGTVLTDHLIRISVDLN